MSFIKIKTHKKNHQIIIKMLINWPVKTQEGHTKQKIIARIKKGWSLQTNYTFNKVLPPYS